MIDFGLIVCTDEYDRKDAYELHMKLESYKTAEYRQHVANCRSNEDFYFGRQWDREEIDKNKSEGNYTITINYIAKAIDFIAGGLTAQRPKVLAIPLAPEYSYQCALANKIYEWHYDKCDGLGQTMDWVHDAINHNISYKFVYANEYGEPETDLLSYEDVIVDPASRKPLFEDARTIFVRKIMSSEEACAKYGIEVGLKASPTKFFSSDYGAENYVRGTLPTDVDRVTSYYSNIEVGRVFSVDSKYVEIYEAYSKIKVKANGNVFNRIMMETLIGYEYIYREILPESITDYPIIPMYVKKGRNPYAIGLTEDLREPQKLANKVHGVMLKNSTTVGFPKTLIPKNLVPNNNFAKFKKDFNKPNAVLEYNPIGTDAAKGIVTIQGQPISDGIIYMYNSALSIMEFQTAPRQAMGFQNSNKDNAGADMQTTRDMSIDSLKKISRNLERATNQHAKMVLQYARGYMTEDKTIEISCGMEAIKRVKLNQRMKLRPSDEASVEQFRQAMLQSGKLPSEVDQMVAKAKDDDEYLDSIADFILNDSRKLNVVLRMVPDSYNSITQDNQYAVMKDLASMGAAIPPEILIDNSSLSNKEEVKIQISTVTKLQSEIKAMMDNQAKMQQALDTKDKELLKAQQDIAQIDHEAKLHKIEIDERAKVKVNVQSHRASLESNKKDFNISADKILFALEQLFKQAKEGNMESGPEVTTNLLDIINGGE